MSAKENLKTMLLEKSVRTGDFTLASGKKSDLYVDCRVTALDNKGAQWIGDAAWELVLGEIEAKGLEVDASAKDGNTPLMMAASRGHSKTVSELIGKSATVNLKNNIGNTPLMLAVMASSEDCVQLLLNAGANISSRNNKREHDTSS